MTAPLSLDAIQAEIEALMRGEQAEATFTAPILHITNATKVNPPDTDSSSTNTKPPANEPPQGNARTSETTPPAPHPITIRVIPVKTTGGARPDGLKDDAPKDVGFSFAVAEADLEIDTTHLSPQQIAAVHQVLMMAGTDDWMDYSHLLTHDAAKIKAGETLALRFSSAAKGARVIGYCLTIA